MRISFTNKMKVYPNLTYIEHGTIKLNDTYYPIIDVKLLHGNLSDPDLLRYNWSLINFTTNELTIQLNFENHL